MNLLNYSTKSPIVLKINDTLNICFEKELLQLPALDQCSNALHLIIHHLNVYQKVTQELMENSVSVQSLAVYIAVTHYYWDVVLAFCKEVKYDDPGSNKTWCSAHLDYDFAMVWENNAFSKEMQKAALSKIKQMWTDFKHKKLYRPVMQHDNTTANHKMSVEDIVAEIVKASIVSMPTEVNTEKGEKLIWFDNVVAEPQKNTKCTTVCKVKMTFKQPDSATASSISNEVEEDDIDETAHMFEMKEDGRKPHKSVKGGHLQKQKNRVNCATGSLRTQGKRTASADVESKDETGDEDKNVNKVTAPSINDTSGRHIDKGHMSSVREESKPTSATSAAQGKGKMRAIVESDDKNESSNDAACVPESTPMPVWEPTLSKSKTKTQMDTESSQKQSNKSVVVVNEDDNSDDLIGYPDENLPSTLDNWEEMHPTAFWKGNSHMFMKLGTWILLQFRQLAKILLEEDPEGLLIPDHPANYQMDFDADFHKALGMTCMVSVKHWPYCIIEELDAEADRDDKEDVSGALSDMIISGVPVKNQADGGRGSSKWQKSTAGNIFIHHSSLTTTSIEGIISQPSPVDTLEAASSSIPSNSRTTWDYGMDTTADPVYPPQLTPANQHHDSISDHSDIESNMITSFPSNSQDAEEDSTDPDNYDSLARINFMHDSSVDKLLDLSQQSTQPVNDIMEDSNIMEGSDEIEGSDIVEGENKKEVVLSRNASLDSLSRATDEDVRVLVKSTPE
ncbi:hypothetical protein BDR06DRAFT_966983 [Suillus hirtellus]|nr:hypothetical protein BDR06DRAFT_966983 [Suillus hirtellus]